MYSVPPAYSSPSMSPRPMRLSQILEESFKLYRRHFSTFAAIALLTALPGLFLGLFLNAIVQQDMTRQAQELQEQALRGAVSDFRDMLPFLGTILNIWLLSVAFGSIDFLIFRPLAVAATAVAVRDAYVQRPTPLTALSAALGRIVPLIIWSIIYGAILWAPILLILLVLNSMVNSGDPSMAGFICLILPLWLATWLVLGVKLIFGTRAIALENISVAEAWRRTWDLTRGAFWRVLGVALALYVLMMILGLILGALIGGVAALATGDTAVGNILTTVISQIIGAFLTPILYIGLTLLYYDRRRERDGAASSGPAAATNQGIL